MIIDLDGDPVNENWLRDLRILTAINTTEELNPAAPTKPVQHILFPEAPD